MLSNLRARMRAFLKATGGNIAMTMALSAIPLTLAMGAGVDYARGLVVHSQMADALDAAALAVGKQATKPTACSTAAGSTSQQKSDCAGMLAVAQKFFDANYKGDSITGGTQPTVAITIANSGVTLSANDNVNTTFLSAGGRLLGTTALNTMGVTASSTVVWGQTKLWVSLVLDNSGSMSDSDSHGSKMDALQSASHTLLDTLEDASTTVGDVEVAIVPFDRVVNVGTANKSAAWLYWGFWETAGEASGTVITDTTAIANQNASSPSTIAFSAWGPGDDCPFTYDTTSHGHTRINTQSPFGYTCTNSPTNGDSDTDTIPSSGTYKGYICPGADPGTYNTDRHDHYYNGCWTSTKVNGSTVRVSTGSSADCSGFSSSNCSCTGSGSSKHCDTQKWTHAWVINNHSTWTGCITDREQDYDIAKTTPVSSNTTGMPATNSSDGNGCLSAGVTALGYDWSGLSTKIDNMSPHGTTNQAIGVANGWLALTPGDPYATPTVPSNTTRYIILLSDGLNTEDRWYGNGSSTGTSDTDKIDTREELACTAAKADGVIIYALFLDITSAGDSAPLQNCASDSSKYFDLTSTTQVTTAFASIAQQITNLRVSK